MSEVRMPTQKRSIEKRKKIIEKGFKLMCENGFYNTTTDDIAKYCDVSTGIIYQYFNDKKDIFLEGTKEYASTIMYPMIDILENEKINITNFKELISLIIDKLVTAHNISKRAHEELIAMEHLDEDISKVFKSNELLVTEKIVNLLINNKFHVSNLREKVHIIYNIIDNFCHEVVYHKHAEINYEIMKEEVINIVTNTLK